METKIRFTDASKVAEDQLDANKASNLFQKFAVKPGDRVFLCCRESTESQRPNLADQYAAMRKAVKQCGATVVGKIRRVVPGCRPEMWIGEAVAKAKKRKATVLLFESTDRAVRPIHFNTKASKDAQAKEDDLYWLTLLTGGMKLMTMIHPDTPAKAVRSHQRKRGQQAKGNRGGRPPKQEAGYKKQRRDKCLPRFLELLQVGDLKWSFIASKLASEIGEEIPIRTLRNWKKLHS